jgi:hypothetical protein
VGGATHRPEEEKKAMKNNGYSDMNVPKRFQMSELSP